jgi:hypothetical protein
MRPLHQIACRVVTVTQEQMALKRKQESVTNIKPRTSMRIRVSRFFSDRYAYRERPDYLVELVAFGIIAIPTILSVANAMATLR